MTINHYKYIHAAKGDGTIKYKNLIRTLQVSHNFCIHKLITSDQVDDDLIRQYNNGKTSACYTRWQDMLILTHIHTGAKLGIITCSKAHALRVVQELEAAFNWDFSNRAIFDRLSVRKKSHLHSIVQKLKDMV